MDFLSRFPKIFTVIGNKCVILNKQFDVNFLSIPKNSPTPQIHISPHKDNGGLIMQQKTFNSNTSVLRSKEEDSAALEYYAKILKKYTSNAGIDIARLFGYRGQASHQVQNAAKNPKELRIFLCQHPKTFTVRGGIVLLTATSNSQDALNFYQNILSNSKGKNLALRSLLGHRGQAPLTVQSVARNECELMDFLLQFPNIFTVTGDKCVLNMQSDVSHLSIPKNNTLLQIHSSYKNNSGLTMQQKTFNSNTSVLRSKEEDSAALEYYAKILKKCTSNAGIDIARLFGYRGQASHQVQNAAKNPKELRIFLCQHPKTFTVRGGIVLLTATSNLQDALNFYQNILSNSKGKNLALRSLLGHRGQAPLNVQSVARNEYELRKLISSYPSIFTIENEIVFLTDSREETTTQLLEDVFYFPTIDSSYQPNHFRFDDWETRVINNTIVIENLSDCLQICKTIEKEIVIAFDCEGYNLGCGVISIIQIGLTNGQIYIFDILKDRHMVRNGGLKIIMESQKIVKVVNYCRNDCLNLKRQFGVKLKYVFDVSIAYSVVEVGNLTMSNFKAAGFNQICTKYGAPVNSCKDAVKNIYRTDRHYWMGRPMTEQMIAYSALDVASLVPYLYSEFVKKLDAHTDSVVYALSQKLCEI